MSTENCDNKSFGTIRNNTALKHFFSQLDFCNCFGTIRNNTALKLNLQNTIGIKVLEPFETITALKHRIES